MRHLTVFQSLALILAIILLSFSAVSMMEIWWLRGTIIEEREQKVRDMVDSVVHLLAAYDAQVNANKLTLAEAQTAAKTAIRGMRWGKEKDYYGVYQWDGVTLVHP